MSAELIERLQDEADQCRNDGADDIAELSESAVDHIALLHDALDHIARSAAASVTSTRRLRWIEQRARAALEGRKTQHKATDLPRNKIGCEVRRLKQQLFDLRREFGRSGDAALIVQPTKEGM